MFKYGFLILVLISSQCLCEGTFVQGVAASANTGVSHASALENGRDFSEDHVHEVVYSIEFVAEAIKHALETLNKKTYEKLEVSSIQEKVYPLANSVKTRLFEIISDSDINMTNAKESTALIGAAFAGQLLRTHSGDISVPKGSIEDYHHLCRTVKFSTMALDHIMAGFVGRSSYKKLQTKDVQDKLKEMSQKVASVLKDIRKGLKSTSDLDSPSHIFRRGVNVPLNGFEITVGDILVDTLFLFGFVLVLLALILSVHEVMKNV